MADARVGSPVRRKEGPEKANGKAQYVDDLDLPGLLHRVTVRSTVARGRIRAIRFADGAVNHPEEPVVLLSHADRGLLQEAQRKVAIDIDPLPGDFTIADSLEKSMSCGAATTSEIDHDREWPHRRNTVELQGNLSPQEVDPAADQRLH